MQTSVYLIILIHSILAWLCAESKISEQESQQLTNSFIIKVLQGNVNNVKSSQTKVLSNSTFMTMADEYTGKAEEYDVTTEDNYILKLFRIRGDPNKVALLTHGILSSSDDFFSRGNTSLVFTAVQAGYDVWAINFRGNRYSRRHKTLNPDTDSKFWDYSMNEMGYCDLPAVIDFILKTTGQKQLSVVGHSEGVTTVFVLASTRPEYNRKIKIMVGLAPAAFLSDCGFVLSMLIPLCPLLESFASIFNINEVLAFNSIATNLLDILCSESELGYTVCVKGLMESVGGEDSDNLEPEFLNSILEHYPAGTSVKNLVHFCQVHNNNRFAKYDYKSLNNDIYGSELPPEYNLKNITCKVALFGAKNDQVVGLKEVERLRNELPNIVNVTIINDDLFAHQSYVWGRNAYKVAYLPAIEILNKYN